MHIGWQPFRGWKLSPPDKHWNDRNLTFQCRLDFNPHEIARVFKSGFALTVLCSSPVWPDYRKEYIALGHLVIQMLAKIDTKGNGIHIHKHGLAPKLLNQPVIDPTSHIGTIFTTIGKKDLAHGSALYSRSPSWFDKLTTNGFYAFSRRRKSRKLTIMVRTAVGRQENWPTTP